MKAFLAVLAASAAAAGIGACGSPGPLDQALNGAQQRQLVAMWSAYVHATDPADLPAAERGSRASALVKACAPADQSSPLLTAVAATCGPVATAAKLGAVLPERCATPAAICVRALDRAAAANDELGQARRTLNTQAALAISDPDCRAVFAATETRLRAGSELSAAYRVLALGIEQKDEEIAALGQRRIDAANQILVASGTDAQRVDAFRKACQPTTD